MSSVLRLVACRQHAESRVRQNTNVGLFKCFHCNPRKFCTSLEMYPDCQELSQSLSALSSEGIQLAQCVLDLLLVLS